MPVRPMAGHILEDLPENTEENGVSLKSYVQALLRLSREKFPTSIPHFASHDNPAWLATSSV